MANTPEQLDDSLVDAFVNRFLGHGTFNAPFWFVGKEEGGEDDVDRIRQKLNTWDSKGRPELESFQTSPTSRWFRSGARLQPTWRYLIRAVLTARGSSMDKDVMRDYQIHRLGRADGETCLVDLMPMPAKSSTTWIYDTCTTLPYLRTRQRYWDHCVALRSQLLRDRIAEHQPQAVAFYSTDQRYIPIWWRIAGNQGFDPEHHDGFKIYRWRSAGTTFIICSGPTTPGMTYAYYERVGELLG